MELAFGRAGAGSEPLVCVHGITAQHRSFNAIARHVSPSRGMVSVDLRGRGNSDKPDAGYGLEVHAEDMARMLDYLGLERAVFAGHSMGAFVGVQAALMFPERVEALILLDGGWPRVETAPERLSEEQRREAEALQEGLQMAYSRLDMTFASPDDYLDFWFPGQGLKTSELPPELADYYLYDLERTEDGYRPKASSAAVGEDSPWVAERAPTAREMRRVRCPVALVRASEGFFPGSRPLISAEARAVMADVLDLRSDTFLEGANHYSMLFGEYAQRIAECIEDFLLRIR